MRSLLCFAALEKVWTTADVDLILLETQISLSTAVRPKCGSKDLEAKLGLAPNHVCELLTPREPVLGLRSSWLFLVSKLSTDSHL